MNFLELVNRRQSVRRYAPGKRIPREVLDRCLEAARLAPSACNSQPWSFVVVDDPEKVRALAEAACSHPPYGMNHFAADASAIVAVVTEKMKWAARIGAQFRGVQYSLVDIGIASEHLVLQAAEEGICHVSDPQLAAIRVVDIDGRVPWRRRAAAIEQELLGSEILVHRVVEVQVVSGQVREYRGVEPDAVDSPQC